MVTTDERIIAIKELRARTGISLRDAVHALDAARPNYFNYRETVDALSAQFGPRPDDPLVVARRWSRRWKMAARAARREEATALEQVNILRGRCADLEAACWSLLAHVEPGLGVAERARGLLEGREP